VTSIRCHPTPLCPKLGRLDCNAKAIQQRPPCDFLALLGVLHCTVFEEVIVRRLVELPLVDFFHTRATLQVSIMNLIKPQSPYCPIELL